MYKLLITILGTFLWSQSFALQYSIQYGKFAHLKTNAKVVSFVMGNDTWDVKPSPTDDGLYIWSRKNSLPVNIKLYTYNKAYTFELTPSTTKHNSEINAKGENYKSNQPISVSTPSPMDKLMENAHQNIIQKKLLKKTDELQNIPNKQSQSKLNIHTSKYDELKRKHSTNELAENSDPEVFVDETGVINIKINYGTANKTVREVIETYANKHDWTPLIMDGDERALDVIVSSDIKTLDELYVAANSIEHIYFIPEMKAIRVKPRVIQHPAKQNNPENKNLDTETAATAQVEQSVNEVPEQPDITPQRIVINQTETQSPKRKKTIGELIRPILSERKLEPLVILGDEKIYQMEVDVDSINDLSELYAVSDGAIRLIQIDDKNNLIRLRGL